LFRLIFSGNFFIFNLVRMKKSSLLFVLFFLTIALRAQIGINNSNPDSKSVLDMKATDKGLLIPRLTSIQREAMSSLTFVQGMMVYDTDLDILFVGYGVGASGNEKWYAMNPWKTEYRTDANADTAHMTTMTSGIIKHGNVGIGTLTPTKKLTISGNNYQFGIKNTTRKDIWGLTNLSNNLYFQYTPNGSSASNKMTLTSSGYLGIGTTSPTHKLHVNGSTMLSGDSVLLCQSSDISAGNVGVGFGGYNNVKLAIKSTHYFALGVEGNIFLTQTLSNSGGNVGVGFGGYSYAKLAVKSNQALALRVEGNAKISGGGVSLCNSLDNSEGNMVIGGGLTSTNVKLALRSNQDFALYVESTDWGVYVKTGKNSQPGSSSWYVHSDARLKEGVVSYSDGLNKLLQIKPVKFHYTKESGIGSGQEYVGVIAQDIAKIAPYMVQQAPIPGLEGEYYNLDNSAMTYMLINAVKEQQDQIEALKNEVEALKNK
jgi:hypothetical protein